MTTSPPTSRRPGRLRVGAAALPLLLALAGCPGGEPPPAAPVAQASVAARGGGIVRGVVTFSGIDYGLAQAGDAMPGAEVYLEGLPTLRTRSDASGAFELVGVPVGEHHVVAEKLIDGTVMKVRNRVDLSVPEQTTDLRSLVLRRTGSLTGTIALAGQREGLLGADVFVAGTTLVGKAKDDGAFAFTSLAEGSYKLTASFPGYKPQTLPIEVKAGKAVELAFDLVAAAPGEAPLRLEGTVEGPDGAPLPGAALSLQGPLSLSTLSAEGGRFTLANVPPGNYTLVVFHPAHALRSRTLVVEAPAEGEPAVRDLGPIALGAADVPGTPPPLAPPPSPGELPGPLPAPTTSAPAGPVESASPRATASPGPEASVRPTPSATPQPTRSVAPVPLATRAPQVTLTSQPTTGRAAEGLPGDAPVWRLSGHKDDVTCLAFGPDDATLFSGSLDRIVLQWELRTGKVLKAFEGANLALHSLAVSPDGARLAAGAQNGTIRQWGVDSGKALASLGLRAVQNVTGLAFSPDGRALASAADGGYLTVWDAAAGSKRAVLAENTPSITFRDVAFSPDGATLVSAGANKTVQLWDVARAAERLSLKGHTNLVQAVAFHPGGKLVASGGLDGVVRLWDLGREAERHTLAEHARPVRAVAFSPDGRLLASASQDQTVMLWDVETGKLLRTLASHADGVWDVRFSPNGGYLATCGSDNAVHVWELQR